jgi:hypothetical protein
MDEGAPAQTPQDNRGHQEDHMGKRNNDTDAQVIPQEGKLNKI